MNLQVGDVVFVARGVTNLATGLAQAMCGVIKHIKNPDEIGVEFQVQIHGGHNLGGHCLNGYGYYLHRQHLLKMEPVNVVLQRSWERDWKPKIKKKVPYYQEPIILIED